MISLEGEDIFKGRVLHSSGLDDVDMEGKKVLILGSGASGVEAAELAVARKAGKVTVLARGDKWIIPRNIIIDIALSLNPLGRQTPLSFIWEFLLRKLHYRSLEHMSPAGKGIFESTPVVNDSFLQDVRDGRTRYVRGDAIKLVPEGMLFHERKKGEKPTRDPKEQEQDSTFLESDIIIMATGYERPSIDFLPQDLFPCDGERLLSWRHPESADMLCSGYQGDYHRPNLYVHTKHRLLAHSKNFNLFDSLQLPPEFLDGRLVHSPNKFELS